MIDPIEIPEFAPHIDIFNIDDLECVLTDLLDEYCDDIADNEGMTTPATDDEKAECDCAFMWTNEAIKLVDIERQRLREIAEKYFPDQEFSVETSRIIEP